MTFNTAKLAAETMPKIRRAQVYGTWRKRGLLAENQVAAIESMFPVEHRENPPLPSLPNLAMNAGKAVARNIVHILKTGTIKKTEEEIDRCHAICLKCPSDLYRQKDNRCAHSACGCFLKSKTWLKAEHCPAGHW